MAQWQHQYSGLNHASKADDRQALLQEAVTQWNSGSAETRSIVMRKKILRLAVGVAVARVKLQKARLNHLGPLPPESSIRLRAEQSIAQMISDGPEAVIAEFNPRDW